MGQGRGRARSALWGGVSLGVGTVAFALFSPSSVSCSTNVVVLTHSAVTARGCAAYSVVAHLGVGLIVLGAVLLLGSFALALRNRRHVVPVVPAGTAESDGTAGGADTGAPRDAPTAPSSPAGPPPTSPAPPIESSDPILPTRPTGPVAPDGTPTPTPTVVAAAGPEPDRVTVGEPVPAGPIPPGADVAVWQVGGPGPLGSTVQLPPGWYGNPHTPGKPVQWWDGTKLTDRPE